MKIWKSVACLTFVLCSASVLAKEENSPFAALQWTFGSETMKPDVVIGYRSVDVETDGDVSGWQGSVSYKPNAGLDKIKLEAIKGDENMQASVGGGYSLQQKQALVSAGVNGSHLTAGADYLISSHVVQPYVGVTTLGSYDVPAEPASPAPEVHHDYSAPVNDGLQEEYFPEYTDCAC